MTDNMKRREFLSGLTAATALTALAEKSEQPLLRIGATTDDHLHPSRPKTHERAKACFALFRREQVDIVVDTGDIADLRTRWGLSPHGEYATFSPTT